MAKRIEYQIVGRYMSGKEVTGYHLQSIETGKSGKYTRDQVAFLVGRDQISNCTAQLYQDKVLLRGKGMSLEDLPVQYEDGNTRNTEKLGRITKGTSTSQAMEQFLIVGTIKSGKNTVGYVIQNAGCGIKRIKRQQLIELAKQGKIGNAKVQMYQGKPLLRGINCNLDELPCEKIAVTPDKSINNDKINILEVSTKIMKEVDRKAGSEFILQWDDDNRCKFYDRKHEDQSNYTGIDITVYKNNAQVELKLHIGNKVEENVIGSVASLEEAKKCAIQIINVYNKYSNEIKNNNIVGKLKESRDRKCEQLDIMDKTAVNSNNTNRKTRTVTVIRPSQLYIKGSEVRQSSFEVALVDFGVVNDNLNEEELRQKLLLFKNKISEESPHRFNNTDDMISENIRGRKAMTTFDDSLYTTLKEYKELANRVGAQFLVDSNVIIFDANGEELSGEELKNAQSLLVRVLKEKENSSSSNRLITLRSLTYDLKYSPDNLTYGVMPYIVDYLAKTEQELQKFLHEVHSMGFAESEHWDGGKLKVVEDSNNGKHIQEYFCNLEDGCGRIRFYLEIAKKTNAELVIAKDITILDRDGCEITYKDVCKKVRDAVYKFAKENNISVKHVI